MTDEDFRSLMLSFRAIVIERLDGLERVTTRQADALERLVTLVERRDDQMNTRYDALVQRIERLEIRVLGSGRDS
jgi:hypothetical protein